MTKAVQRHRQATHAQRGRVQPNASIAKIGLLGLGAMGTAIAKRLISAGWEVWGRDINPDAENRASAIGVKIGNDRDIRSVDALLTSLPDDESVTQALLGPDGMVWSLRPGAIIVETSTILPGTVRAIFQAAAKKTVKVIDCAVSGGPDEAQAGTLVLLVGGEARDVANITPLLNHMGTVTYAGKVGDGKTVKLVNNIMTMGNIAVAAEAFNLGLKAGIPAQRLYDILAISGGRSHQFLKRFPYLLRRDFTGRFSLALGHKDLTLALKLAEGVGAEMAATTTISELFGAAIRTGPANEDIVAVAKLYERRNQIGVNQLQ